MRIHLLCPTAAAAAFLFAGPLAGCASGPTGTPGALPANAPQAQTHFDFRREVFGSGLDPMADTPPGDVAVSDFEGAVEVLNSSYHVEQTITNGLRGNDGDWYDANENLYVANYAGVNVQEYKHDATSPSFTYSSGLGDPVRVSTDAAGNVYVADFGGDYASVIVEYPQKRNTPIHVCSTGLANAGIAIDKAGDVFVSGINSKFVGNIMEYAGGLSGCHGKTLRPVLSTAGALTIDKQGALIAADQNGAVDIIKKPYTSVNGTCGSGYYDPYSVALNRAQNLLFVADPGNGNVQVLNYPACTLNKTLGSANGLYEPLGVAAHPGRSQ